METRRRSFTEKIIDGLGISDRKIYEGFSEKDKKKFDVQYELGFHAHQLSRIRNIIGKKLTYIGHIKSGDEHSIKVNLLTPSGKKNLNFNLEVHPSKMNENDYNFILEQIQKAV